MTSQPASLLKRAFTRVELDLVKRAAEFQAATLADVAARCTGESHQAMKDFCYAECRSFHASCTSKLPSLYRWVIFS